MAGTFVMHIRLPEQVLKRIKRFAKSEHRADSNMALVLIEEGLAAREKEAD